MDKIKRKNTSKYEKIGIKLVGKDEVGSSNLPISSKRFRILRGSGPFSSYWIGKPPAQPVEVPRKKALASSIERSELLTANYQ